MFGSPAAAGRGWVIGLVTLSGIMLVAMVFYPFGYDQAVFSTGGAMIVHGAFPYRDFLDTKPPLIFYLYAGAQLLFGTQEWSIRLFDILWHGVTAFYFYRILRRYFSIERSLVSISLTIILYAGSGFWMTAQAESFGILPSLLLFDCTLRAVEHPERAVKYGAIAGLAATMLLLLKVTLILSVGAAMVMLFLASKKKIMCWLAYTAALVVVVLALSIIVGVALVHAGAGERFLEWVQWISQYASITSLQHPAWEELLVEFPLTFLYSMSPLLFFFAGRAVIEWNRNTYRPEQKLFFRLLALTIGFHLIGILLERKIEFEYQYTRYLWAATPFAAIGLFYWESAFRKFRLWNWPVGTVLFILLMFTTSPLARLFTQTLPWSWVTLRHGNAAAEVQRRIPNYFSGDEERVAQYLNTRMKPSEQLFFWGNDVAIYGLTNRMPQTSCLTATPFRTTFTPLAWKDSLIHQLSTTSPAFFVVEFGDARPESTGSKLDSYQALNAWDGLRTFLTRRYVLDTTIGHFFIFARGTQEIRDEGGPSAG